MDIKSIESLIRKTTHAESVHKLGTIQSLWSGYGTIDRYGVIGGNTSAVIVKHIDPPNQSAHPRGWNTNVGHQRKLKSYQVETAWYKRYAGFCTSECRIPTCLHIAEVNGEKLIILEDLDQAGFNLRPRQISVKAMEVCLRWLANFHATFLHQEPIGLWQTGTYWHLETRPEEWAELEDRPLKEAAAKIDLILKQSPFQTFVHGDAKLANFCFNKTHSDVAAVDFQYVGGGPGVKDIAYFIGSCLYEEACERHEGELLNTYFRFLETALVHQGKMDKNEFRDLESNWRSLFPIAWTDFHRFLKGWHPGHWKINTYSERLARQVIDRIS